MLRIVLTVILLIAFLLCNLVLPEEKGKKIKWFFAILYVLVYTAMMPVQNIDIKKEFLYGIITCNLLFVADAGTLLIKNKENKKTLLYVLKEAFVIVTFNITMVAVLLIAIK